MSIKTQTMMEQLAEKITHLSDKTKQYTSSISWKSQYLN